MTILLSILFLLFQGGIPGDTHNGKQIGWWDGISPLGLVLAIIIIVCVIYFPIRFFKKKELKERAERYAERNARNGGTQATVIVPPDNTKPD